MTLLDVVTCVCVCEGFGMSHSEAQESTGQCCWAVLQVVAGWMRVFYRRMVWLGLETKPKTKQMVMNSCCLVLVKIFCFLGRDTCWSIVWMQVFLYLSILLTLNTIFHLLWACDFVALQMFEHWELPQSEFLDSFWSIVGIAEETALLKMYLVW